MVLPDIRNVDVKGKTVFLRLDLDVPLCKYEIEDETRLIAGLPTVQYLLDHGARVIIGGHLGRPEPEDRGQRTEDRNSEENIYFSLEPVAAWFDKKIKYQRSNIKNTYQKSKINDFEGWKISENLFLLENLRFYEGEEANDSLFAKKLASLSDIYVNDAFAMCHRDHASVSGITKFLPSFAGLHLQKEVSELGNLLNNPKRPMVVIIGGVKIETKLPLVLKMYELSDYVLVGGKIAQKKEELNSSCQMTTHKCVALTIAQMNSEGTDLTDQDIKNFTETIGKAKTIIWNGPVGFIRLECRIRDGIIEEEESERGTRMIAQAIVNTNAYKVAGGGDTIEFLQKMRLTDRFDFVSTGGGAMLSFLSGEKLPGLEALTKEVGKVPKVSEVSKGEINER